MLREISDRKYERRYKYFFMNLSRMLCIRNYRCAKFVRVLHRSEEFARICHICEKFARILHRCDKYVRIFSHLWQIHWTFTFERICHTCEELARICHTCENQNEFFTGVTNTYEFFTRLKLDICEKLVPIKISKLVVRIFHTYQNVMYACE